MDESLSHPFAVLAAGADSDENPWRRIHNPLKETSMAYVQGFKKALQMGRPPNITSLFPNSRALIVSGKVIDRALRAAQRANAALIIEIAKFEGGQRAYCAVNNWDMARDVDALCNEMGITTPVAIHADHYGIKNEKDLAQALLAA